MIQITAHTSGISATLRAVAAEISAGRPALANAADEALKLIRTHLAGLAATRHATASRLGATPTGHIRAQAARRGPVTDTSATIEIGIPGIRRAWHDITIRPRQAAALTIPVHRLAYGRTARDLGTELRIFRPRGKDYLATTDAEGNLTVLYLLRKIVHQRRDPSLMPTKAQLTAAVTTGYSAALRRILAQRSAS